MFRTVVVGYDGSDQAKDAVELAREFAGEHTRIIAANIYELGGSIPAPGYAEWANFMKEDAERELAEIGEGVETRARGDHSVAYGLQRIAEEEDADLIVVGSCHYGPVSRVLAGSVGEKLLRNSPCAVAIAPDSYPRKSAHPGSVAETVA